MHRTPSIHGGACGAALGAVDRGVMARPHPCRSGSSPAPKAEAISSPSLPGSDGVAAASRGSPRSRWDWPTQSWAPVTRQGDASEVVSPCSSSGSSLHTPGSLVNVAATGTMRRATNDPSIRDHEQSLPRRPHAFVAGSLSTTSAGSTSSVVRSPRQSGRHVGSSGWDSPDFAKPSTPPSSTSAWYQCLLEDAQAVALAVEMPAAGDGEKQRTEEMNVACSTLGQELSKLNEFLKWAETVVSNAEAGRLSPQRSVEVGKCSAQGRATFESPCRYHSPARFYIGDGLVAQLLADAEAVARVV